MTSQNDEIGISLLGALDDLGDGRPVRLGSGLVPQAAT